MLSKNVIGAKDIGSVRVLVTGMDSVTVTVTVMVMVTVTITAYHVSPPMYTPPQLMVTVTITVTVAVMVTAVCSELRIQCTCITESGLG